MAKGKNCLGLDIGSSSVKVCELRSRKDQLHLEAFDYEELPPETIVDGELMNATAVADSVEQLLERNNIRRKPTALSVSGNTVIIKKITLPLMTQEELEESIQWEAEQFIPYEIDDVFIGFEVLAPKTEQGQMDVVLVAAKKEMINDYVEVCHRVGLKPMVVDVDSFAVQNMYEVNHGFHQDETVNLLDMGNSVISMNIVKDGITTFTRDLSSGGSDITGEIQRQLNITYKEAEVYKMGGTPSGTGEDEVVPGEVERIIQDKAKEMAEEVQESINFYSSTAAEGNIDRIVVTGGTGAIPSLRRIISSTTGVECELANPFEALEIDKGEYSPKQLEEWAPIAGVALGLALRRTNER
jgi:type IV pilus assembly protein PilM